VGFTQSDARIYDGSAAPAIDVFFLIEDKKVATPERLRKDIDL
jgi:hypothetical protein